jgi:hypothetical protein
VAEHKASNGKVTQRVTTNFETGNAPSVTIALPREEKRREEKNKEIPPLSPKGENARFHPEQVILPPELDTDAFHEAWTLWCRHRREIKKPLKPTMAEQQLNQFVEWGESRSIAAIRHTVAKGWQGIQEPEHRRNGKIVNPAIGDLF